MIFYNSFIKFLTILGIDPQQHVELLNLINECFHLRRVHTKVQMRYTQIVPVDLRHAFHLSANTKCSFTRDCLITRKYVLEIQIGLKLYN